MIWTSSTVRSQTHAFRYDGKKIVLALTRPNDVSKGPLQEKDKKVAQKSLSVLNKKQFEKGSQEEGVVYAIIATSVGETPEETPQHPPEVRQILSDFSNIMPD